MFDEILNLGNTIIDKIFPNKADADRAKAELLKQSQAGEFKALDLRYSAILAEASSQDKWTSRARPSFLYVMYIMILFSIPMGGLHAYNGALAASIALGMQQWLGAIPDSLYTLFGVCFTGYTVARTYEKNKMVAKR